MDIQDGKKVNATAKRKDGTVYSTVAGNTDFHMIENVEVDGKIPLGEVLQSLRDDIDELNETNKKIIKKAFVDIYKRLEKIEKAVEKYGMVD